MWQTNSVRWRNGQQRVLRGGNWLNNERNQRSAYRNHNSPDNRNNHTGLRLAGALQIGIVQIEPVQFKSVAGGSVNQLSGTFTAVDCCDKRTGAGRVSRRRVDARTVESLPRCRPFQSPVYGWRSHGSA